MKRLPTILALASICALVGCRPSYPACKNDGDCNREKDRHEFCVNQLCQKCRSDKDCAPGTQCNKGRCDAIAGYCDDDRGCPADAICKDHKCTACTDDGQCGEGGKCKQGRCVRKGMCEVDDDCPDGQDCKAGRCVAAAPVSKPQGALCKLQSVLFDFNESVLSTEATQAIDSNYLCIQKVGRVVQLIGRSDPRGTEEYNLALSERRAEQVKERLSRLGLDSAKMSLFPKGELDATGRDEAGWANDRRVDFEWQ